MDRYSPISLVPICGMDEDRNFLWFAAGLADYRRTDRRTIKLIIPLTYYSISSLLASQR